MPRLNTVIGVVLLAGITWASLMPRGGAGDPGEHDIIAHVAAYALVALVFMLGREGRSGLVLLAILGWSGVIEGLQPLVGRSGSLADVLSNGIGVAVGAGLAVLFTWRPRRRD